MIGVALIVVGGVTVVALGLLVIARRTSLEYDATRRRLYGPGAGRLVYDVRAGIDPAAVVVALRHAGFSAAEEGATHRVVVFCSDGRAAAQARIRDVVARATSRDADAG